MTDKDLRWLNEAGQFFLEKDYLLPGQSAAERLKIIATTAEKILNKPGYSDKFLDYMSRGWYSLASPIWSNFGTSRGFGISCFNSHIDDDMASILFADAEVGMMTKYGGGTSAYFGDLRHRGAPITNNGHSAGAVHFEGKFENTAMVLSQGDTRRGNFAGYLPVWHRDIKEHIAIRDEGHPLQDISYGVTIPDWWLVEMENGNEEYQDIWALIIESRFNKGYPYIMFEDNANKVAPEVYKETGRKIKSSNLCTEVMLASTTDESFVCDLSSMNLIHYDEWKDTDAVEVLVYLLDAVMSDFIEKASGVMFMQRAVTFAINQRAIGIGVFGYHHYLQSKDIEFESLQARMHNLMIFKQLQEQTLAASQKMAKEYGEPPLLNGKGRRHVTLMTLAPTTSSAFIIGQASQSIEPLHANVFVKDLAKIKHVYKNPYLLKVLQELNQDNVQIWNSIMRNEGSVQHLEFLSEHQKNVFKTFKEIAPFEVIKQAGDRQRFIDQGQSLNLMIDPNLSPKEMDTLLMSAWSLGIKSLYYQKSVNAAQQLSRNILNCTSCEG